MAIIKNNWFSKYSEAKAILVEAGWRENITTGILAAILMIFGGSTLKAAADRNNVKEKDLLNAMQDRPTIEKVYEIYKDNQETPIKSIPEIKRPQMPNIQLEKQKPNLHQQISFDDILNTVLRHEALLNGQTPFRITNPSMKKWNTIHGFEIDKNPQAPSNRQNFIFLKNPQEVPLAVKKQFVNYANNPQKYGLPNNPTLEDAIRTFDQSGSNGKMNFIKKNLPVVDFKIPLISYLSA